MNYLIGTLVVVLMVGPIIVLSQSSFEQHPSKSKDCEKAGGYPITDRGIYKFCINKDSVLEVK